MPRFAALRPLIYCLAACLSPLGTSPAYAAPHNDRCVILISVDGLAGFYLDDPRADMPTLRRLAREGARASGMVCSFPTVTWPNHTTLVTGVPPAVHGVIGNNYFDRQTGKAVALIPDPVYDKDQIVHTPTVYDVAHQAGLKTAGIIWPATRNARSLDWTVPDMAGDDAWPRFGTGSWLAEMRAAGLPVDHHGRWVKDGAGVQRDWLYTRMAAHVLANHAPNLLLIHLIEVDHVEHKYGPRSDDAYWAVSQADDRVRDIVEAAERSPLKGRTTIFVCSDHGFYPIDKEIRPNVVLRQLGLQGPAASDTSSTSAPAAAKSAACVSQGGACAVYILEDARRAAIAAQLRDQFSHLEGVSGVFEPAQFAALGQPTREQDPHGADLWLAAKEGYSFTESAVGDNPVVPRDSRAGTHGHLPSEADLLGTCLIWGPGIKGGASLGQMSNMDVAPTIARILGIDMATAQGKALSAALEE